MSRAKLQLREGYHLILTVHDKGHVSIQEFVNDRGRPPIVLSAWKAEKLQMWLADHIKLTTDDRDSFDPVTDAKKKRERRQASWSRSRKRGSK